MVIDTHVRIIVAKQNRKYYNSFGYDAKNGDEIEVLIEHLPKTANVKIRIQCDYCEKIIDRSYFNHVRQTEKDIIKKDCCVKCKGKKIAESNLMVYGIDSLTKLESTREKMKNTLIDRYGVEHQMHLQETKEKMKTTNLERYGVEHGMQSDEVKEKVKKSNQEKYGVDHYNKTAEYKERVTQTNLEKYGVENVFQVEEFRNKQKSTVQEKYGCDNVFQNEDIKNKSKITMIEKYGVGYIIQSEERKFEILKKQKESLSRNGNVKTSKQQLYLHSILGGELNYSVDHLNLDIAFPEEKIYIEYNGGGHDFHVKTGKMSAEDFKRSEMKRYFIIKNKGWKQIEINSPNDYLPSDDKILDEIQRAKKYLFESDKSHYIIDIGKLSNDNVFGKLRKL